MNPRALIRTLQCGAVLGLVLMPDLALACATCYGESDAPMAKGMNWGIMSLLAMIGMVLAGVTSFFVFLGVRSARMSSEGSESTTT